MLYIFVRVHSFCVCCQTTNCPLHYALLTVWMSNSDFFYEIIVKIDFYLPNIQGKLFVRPVL